MAPRKKPDTTEIVPTLPLPKTPPKNRADKKTHKLGPEHIQLILDMTIAGYTLDEIQKELRDTHKISITESVLCYHRRQNADKLSLTEEEQIKAARARSGYMQLATRVATLEKAITKELKKKNPSGYAISMLMSSIDQTIHKVEALRLKREELARKLNQNPIDVTREEFIKEMDMRARIIKNSEDHESAIIEAGAAEELVVKPPRDMESTLNVPEPEVTAEILEEIDDGLNIDGIDEKELLA